MLIIPYAVYMHRSGKRSKKHTHNFDDKTSDLCHKAVRTSALLVPEYDVCVVVWHQVSELRVIACDASLGEPTGCQGVLRYVGHMLLEHEWG
jgi:hypothetical protein